MSDRYRSEPMNTPEQKRASCTTSRDVNIRDYQLEEKYIELGKAHVEAMNKIESLEADLQSLAHIIAEKDKEIKELRKYSGHWQSCNILNPYSQDECNCGFNRLLDELRANN